MHYWIVRTCNNYIWFIQDKEKLNDMHDLLKTSAKQIGLLNLNL